MNMCRRMKSDNGLKPLFILCIAIILLGGMMIPLANTGTNNDAITSSNTSIMLSYCNGKTLYVGGTGPDNYTKIQDAIDDAHAGDTIFVYSDSSPYYENLVIDKTLNLLGENKENTLIEGGKDEIGVVSVEAHYVNISQFMITTSKEQGIRDGIELGNGLSQTPYVHHIRITDCNFYNFVNAIGCCGFSENITISHCRFWECTRAFFTGEKNNYFISNCNISAEGGIAIHGSNTTVSNCTFHPGKIWIHGSDNNEFLNNYLIDGAIQIEYSSHNFLRNNMLENSTLEFFGHGIEDFHHNIDDSNIMQGKPIYYLYEKRDMVIDKHNNTGYIILAACQNITVRDIELYSSVLAFSSNSIFEDCSFYGNSVGIYVHNSTCNSIIHCQFENHLPLLVEQSCRNNISLCTFSHTIQIWHSSNENSVSKCTLNGGGIYLGDAHNNTLVKCTILNTDKGIEVDGNQNIISLCNISHNNRGILVNGNNNKIYLNNFIANSIHAFCYGKNIWNTQKRGNYWDNYHAIDLNKDGIGLIPYHIKTDHIRSFFNFDWHPLTNPYEW